jgi:hypothetical protein
MPCPVALEFVRLPPVMVGDEEDKLMPYVPLFVIVTISMVGLEELRFRPYPVTFVIVLFLITGEAEVMATPVLYWISAYSTIVVPSTVPSWKLTVPQVPLVPLRVNVM